MAICRKPALSPGSFTRRGLLTIEKGKVDEDALLSFALDAGAEDVKVGEKSL